MDECKVVAFYIHVISLWQIYSNLFAWKQFMIDSVEITSNSGDHFAWPDPTIVIEADGDEDTKKSLKMLAFPVMDDDAVPSSYIQKVQGAIGKWRVKMHAMVAVKDELEEVPESMGQPFASSNYRII